jgi:superoxide dismutase, Cu-Zn family
MRLVAIATLSLALAGCGTEQPTADQTAANGQTAETESAVNGSGAAEGSATAALRTAAGEARGQATVTQAGDGISVRVEAMDMAPGTYAAHIHTTGRCDPPGFESAGGHWNPTSQQHGRDNPQGPHKGDLPNLTVAADGRGVVEFTIPGASVTGGSAAMLDTDGAAMMIHEKADDYRTDPSGDAGARIACGTFG